MARLGDRAVPAQGADLVHAHLPGLDDDLLGVDHRLQHRQGAVVEEESVVVVRRAAEQLDTVGAVAEALLQALDQGFRLQHADLKIVEGRVIVDILAVPDQAVIGDDLDPGSGGVGEGVGQRRAVDGGNDQNLMALRDQPDFGLFKERPFPTAAMNLSLSNAIG